MADNGDMQQSINKFAHYKHTDVFGDTDIKVHSEI